MDSTILMALGEYRFSLETAAYEELTRTHAWRWPDIERIGARPARQFIGPDKEDISLSGTIHPYFKGGLGQLDAMRAEADKGEPLTLVDGTGKVWGQYAILSIKETHRVLFSDGSPRRVEFDLSLGEMGG